MLNKITVLESAFQILSRGGWVLIPIFLLGCFAWYLIIDRYFFYRDFKKALKLKKNIEKFSKEEIAALATTPKQSYFLSLTRAILKYSPKGEQAIKNALEALRHDTHIELSKSSKTISTCASLAPMLGLLGTFSGLVLTFDVINLFGFGNTVFLADGISEALLTTQAGLLVAFPLLLTYNYLTESLERIEAQTWSLAIKVEQMMMQKEDQ